MKSVSHFMGGTPKAEPAVQSAHYSWQHNLPWVLAYISRSYWPLFMYGDARFTADHRCILWNETGTKRLVAGPFMTLYDCVWETPEQFTIEGQDTVLTQASIKRYYEYLAECFEKKIVPAPSGLGSFDIFGGKVPKKDNRSEQYYDFAEADHSSFDSWVADCKVIAEES